MGSFARVSLASAVSLAALAGCYVTADGGGASAGAGGNPASSSSSNGTGTGTGTGMGTGTGSGGNTASGIPCDVDMLLANHCQSCHGSHPSAPMPLMTYADLVAPAVSDPSKRVADLALTRMQSTSAPMPPGSGPTVPATEIAAFQMWISNGLPMGTCGSSGGGGGSGGGGAGGGPPPPSPTVCTSDLYWEMNHDNDSPGGDHLDKHGPWMNPGLACIHCHQNQAEDAIVLLGGTVYPTVHEPDLCYGVDGTNTDAHVEILDAHGKTFTLPIESTGDFSLQIGDGNVSFPITAKVVANGKERHMSTPQSTGDCNGCHTEQGKNGAPGRIYLP